MSAAPEIDETHDPARRSWVAAERDDAADFPLQNLPFGRFLAPGAARARLGVAIGDGVLDLAAAVQAGVLPGLSSALHAACGSETLNAMMGLPPAELRALRRALFAALAQGSRHEAAARPCVLPRHGVQLLLPAEVRNYTDFYTSLHHAGTSGALMRPGSPLPPNFHHLPMAYHGRASSVSVSGTDLHRPCGLVADGDGAVFTPTRKLDFECEVAVWVGAGNRLGERVPLAQAGDHVFGIGLLNDWSARDVQRFEAQPLGPFLGKSFLTSVSAWIVTLQALAPYRVAAAPRVPGAPALSPHLDDELDRRFGGLDLQLEVLLSSARMREAGLAPVTLARPHFREQYWTVFQMLAHHTSNGCNLLPGDLLGSGTVSGAAEHERGCLLEILRDGQASFELPSGERRGWLHDGDELTLRATCRADGRVPIGWGNCTGRVLPARA